VYRKRWPTRAGAGAPWPPCLSALGPARRRPRRGATRHRGVADHLLVAEATSAARAGPGARS